MSYLEIKRAKTREDAASIAGLARTIWTEHYTPIIGSSQVEYMLENIQSAEKIAEAMESGSEYYMAYLYDRLIGYMAIHEDSESMVLSKLYIEKDFRGRRIAGQFILLLQDRAAEAGKDKITLTVNKNNLNSISIYKRMGFEIEGELITDIGGGFVMDDYLMVMRLEQ
ncbi:MAG: GNAT family N-acetyltransferase [Clostridiales bacterium]|jgi:ribosomal protein S18 acetylase RimI-like enzyme|nr:GNAT family N-acetyltransferase [Clostridiales bacterium]